MVYAGMVRGIEGYGWVVLAETTERREGAMDTDVPAARPADGFRHEALFYRGERDFVVRTTAFVRDAVRTSEPTLVVVSPRKIDLLRAELGPDARGVRFEDMTELGHNPAWIIPAWADFVGEHDGMPVRGVGEPVTPDRAPDELVECERHEALLNVAFADGTAWRLVCTYDVRALPPDVLEVATTNHPIVFDGAYARPSPVFAGVEALAGPFDEPLPAPTARTFDMAFTDVRSVRRFVAHTAAGLGADGRAEDLLLAVSEIATNSILHGGGGGVVRLWSERAALVCEIEDAGRIGDPLIGRRRPDATRSSGFGLWLANQICDLVQVRSSDAGTVIRLRVALGRPARDESTTAAAG
jgi:anti-sigma regulatory factor (Ser/Thr protein kinase)